MIELMLEPHAILLGMQIGMDLWLAFFAVYLCVQLASRHAGVPFVPTKSAAFPIIRDELEIVPGDIVYELGSGDGHFLVESARLFPDTQFVGIERNPILYTLSLVRRFIGGNPKNLIFRRDDLFTAQYADATKIYAYLLPEVMERIEPTFKGRHVRFASLAFRFKMKEPANTVRVAQRDGAHNQHMLYIYNF